MKSYQERNPRVIGVVAVIVSVVGIAVALQYDKLPFVSSANDYSAYFAEAGGLTAGAAVQVAGFRVGQVKSVELDGPRVRVGFEVERSVRLGDRSEAAIKTKTVLGAKILEVAPRGDGQLSQAIPLDRTTSPYQLSDALGDLASTISGLNTTQLSDSLATLSQEFANTPPALRTAVDGVSRFADTLNSRDAQLRALLADASKATAVLGNRTDDVVKLVTESNALVIALKSQSSAIDQISEDVSALSTQLRGVVADNRTQLRPALDKVNGVLTILDNRKAEIQQSIKLLGYFSGSLGEAVSSGPFFSAYIANLIPGQFMQPFVDAAFSDLGLDPNVLLPSQLHDPQTGQPGTPSLPPPYPRTGQGGEPKLTLPDAITGNPGDARYPYREPLPAPAPGGPPPGPPAPAPTADDGPGQ